MYRDAFLMLRDLADEFPDVSRHQNHYAWTLATCPAVEFRDPELSLRSAKLAVQLSPQGADFWFSLGLAQYRTGDFAGAYQVRRPWTRVRSGRDQYRRSLVPGDGLTGKSATAKRGLELYRQGVKDAADAPLLHTASVDYRVQRAEADQMFAAAEQDAPAVSSDEQTPEASGNASPPHEGTTPDDEPDPQEEPN